MVLVKKRGKFDIKPPERYNESAMQNENGQTNHFVIGLTGNIGSGKSVVLNMLRHLGAFGIDADALTSMAFTHPGILDEISQRFGDQIIKNAEAIDRKALAQIVFQDAGALADLEAILHPAVSQLALGLIHSATLPIVVIEAIKLLESDLAALCDSIWIVDADEKTVMERLQSRRGMTEAEIRARLANQSPISEKIKKADFVIQNDGSREQTWGQIQSAWKELSSTDRHFNQSAGDTLTLTAPFATHIVIPFSEAAQRIANMWDCRKGATVAHPYMKTDADELESLICERFVMAGCNVMADTLFSVWELSLPSLSPDALLYLSESEENCGGLIDLTLMERFVQLHQVALFTIPIKLPLNIQELEKLTSSGYAQIDSSSDAYTRWVNAGYNVFQKQFWDVKAFTTSVIK